MSTLTTRGRFRERGHATRLVDVARTETGIVRLALLAIALHVVDANFLQPRPGTTPRDHLASGLVPLLVIAATVWLYPRVRAGARATIAMTMGAIGLTVGGPSVYYIAYGEGAGSDASGLLVVLASCALLAVGPAALWGARRRHDSRRRRYLRRALSVLIATGVAFVAFEWVVLPVGIAYVYTHTGPLTGAAPVFEVPTEQVTVTTSDALELRATYVAPTNGAAIVLYPGRSRADVARMLIRHGYGVLLLDPRGQRGSEGDIVRWAGDRDLLAAADYLRSRPEVDRTRIGGMGFSIGGEMLLEAAAQSPVFAAVVSEGAGERVGEQDAAGIERLLTTPMMSVMTAAVTVFSNHRPPPPIDERIGAIAPRPVFLVYADPGMGGESTRQPAYFAAAGAPKQIWNVPGSEHTGGIRARPRQYERRVIGFFDRALLGR